MTLCSLLCNVVAVSLPTQDRDSPLRPSIPRPEQSCRLARASRSHFRSDEVVDLLCLFAE